MVPDYVDAFLVRLDVGTDADTPEHFARIALDRSPALVRAVIITAQRGVLRLRLQPQDPSRVMGWQVRTSTPGLVVLDADGSLLSSMLVVRRVDDRTAAMTTAVHFHRAPARAVWALAPVFQ